MPENEMTDLAEVLALSGSTEWLWYPWIPKGHITMLGGAQDAGKSYLATHIIAVLSKVLDTWPDGEPYDGPTGGKVMLLETETMKTPYGERLQDIGVPIDRIKMPARNNDAFYRPQFPDDTQFVLDKVKEVDCCTGIIMDSLRGAHRLEENSSSMIEVMNSMVAIANATKLPVIIIHHMRKPREQAGAKLDELRGSGAITSPCRSVLGLYRIGDSPTTTVQHIKSNLAPKAKPFSFKVNGYKVEVTDMPTALKTKLVMAEEFLAETLSKGAMRREEIVALAAKYHISETTLNRARTDMNIPVGGGVWALPWK